MAHYCRICGRHRPNEKFSGRGHRTHVCKDCKRMPRQQRDVIERADEIFGYLRQSHISARNMDRLRTLATSPDPHIAELATVVLEVGKVRPYRRKRLSMLARERRDLLHALERTSLIWAHRW